MGHFDRTRRKPKIELPERLKRLDRELIKEQTKDFDYVYAVGCGLRIRVCVMRDVDNKCHATAQLGDHAFRYGGGYSPSGAYLMLVVSLKIAFATMPTEQRQRLQAN
jgi:hypothetical protein